MDPRCLLASFFGEEKEEVNVEFGREKMSLFGEGEKGGNKKKEKAFASFDAGVTPRWGEVVKESLALRTALPPRKGYYPSKGEKTNQLIIILLTPRVRINRKRGEC